MARALFVAGPPARAPVLRPMSFVLRPVSYVLCPMSYVTCPMSYGLCPLSYVLCPMAYVPMSYALWTSRVKRENPFLLFRSFQVVFIRDVLPIEILHLNGPIANTFLHAHSGLNC